MPETIEELQTELAEYRRDMRWRTTSATLFVLSGFKLAAELRDAGRPHEALALLEEALALIRHRGRLRPRKWRRLRAECLEVYAEHLREQGENAAALEALGEAAAIRRRQRMTSEVDAFELGADLWDLTDTLQAEGRFNEALASAGESVTAWERAFETQPVFRAAIGVSHDKRSELLGALGRWDEALDASRKAVALLAADERGPDLASALAHLGDALAALGRDDEAADVRAQAAAVDVATATRD
jgi:tetratricopeptide (TPR) repeat protein